jgi:hypothetical protein
VTGSDFVFWAENVYGKYTTGMKAEVDTWLSTRTAAMLSGLREVVLRDHPYVYKTPPGVHELEAFRIEAQDIGHKLDEARAIAANRSHIAEAPESEGSGGKLREKIAAFREMAGKVPVGAGKAEA